MARMSEADVIEQSVAFMEDEPVIRVEMTSAMFARLTLLDLFTGDRGGDGVSKLGKHPVVIDKNHLPDEIAWIDSAGLVLHVAVLPDPTPKPGPDSRSHQPDLMDA